MQSATYILPQDARPPNDIGVINRIVDDEIPRELIKAQCGGWNTNVSVGHRYFEPIGPAANAPIGEMRVDSRQWFWQKIGADSWQLLMSSGSENESERTDAGMDNDTIEIIGHISYVRGAPGWRGIWDGNGPMAWRIEQGGALNNGYEFPSQATGKTTVCDTNTTEVLRPVWRDPVLQVTVLPPIPPKQSSSASSTPKGEDETNDIPPPDEEDNTNDNGLPGGVHVEVIEPGRYATVSLPHELFTDPPCTNPENCTAFCSVLNSYTYKDCRDFEPVLAVNPADPTEIALDPVTREKMVDTSGNPLVLGIKCADGPDPANWPEKYTCSEEWTDLDLNGTIDEDQLGDTTVFPNCRQQCQGAECRCPGAGCTAVPPTPSSSTPPSPGHIGRIYQSFYRHYDISTLRKRLDEVPRDQLDRVNAEAACYGWHQEVDAKQEAVGGSCTIRFPSGYSQDALKKNQTGIGTTTRVPQADVPIDPRDGEDDDDPWIENLGEGISFLRENEEDLASQFLSLDDARMKAIGSTVGHPVMRQPSDVIANERGDSDVFARWWHRFLEDALSLATPAVIRLRLPSTLAPIAEELPTVSEEARNERWEGIDVQLRAGEDMTGMIADSLKRYLLLRPERVPFAVVQSSPATLRALAQRWEDYKRQRMALVLSAEDIAAIDAGGAYPANVAELFTNIDALIARLEGYATQVDAYRVLSEGFPAYIANLLDRQREILLEIDQWTKTNLERFEAFQEQQRERLSLMNDLRELQTLHARFRDDTALPWCRSDHFTTPIYSLTRQWLPGNPFLSGGTPSCEGGDGLPLLCVPEEFEFVFDLSNFHMRSKGVTVPVPWVIPVELRLPVPPGADGRAPTAEELQVPDLPPIPEFSLDGAGLIETVERRDPLPPQLPDPPAVDLSGAREQMARARTIIERMNDAYARFFGDIEPTPDTEELRCAVRGESPCTYVEGELLQAFTRFTTLGVFLKEHADLLMAEPRVSCDGNDGTCTPMRPQLRPAANGWQVVAPDTDDDAGQTLLQKLRTTARESAIDANGHAVIPYPGRSESLYPIFATPAATDLLPRNEP